MPFEHDPDKRAATLLHRGLDMADAELVFSGPCVTLRDTRHDYGEDRFFTLGLLLGRMVVLVWTWRGTTRRIISMRKANEREQNLYRHQLD
jgi:uncharacterized protein